MGMSRRARLFVTFLGSWKRPTYDWALTPRPEPFDGDSRGSPTAYRVGRPSNCRHNGAISTTRIVRGSFEAPAPPITTGLRESRA